MNDSPLPLDIDVRAAAEPRVPDSWCWIPLMIYHADIPVMRRIRLFVSQKRLVPVFRSAPSVTSSGRGRFPIRTLESFSLIFYDRTKIAKYAAMLQAVAKKFNASAELLNNLSPAHLAQAPIPRSTVQPGSEMWKYLVKYKFVPGTAQAAAEPPVGPGLLAAMLRSITDKLHNNPRTVDVEGYKIILRAGHTGIGGDYPWLILQRADAPTATRMYVEPINKTRPASALVIEFRDSNTEHDEEIVHAKSSEDLLRTIVTRYVRYLRTLDKVEAAAEPPAAAPGREFSKVWLKFFPDARKITVDNISVSVESTDAEPAGIEITMPDHEIFFAQERTRDGRIFISVVGRSDRGPFPVIDPATPASVMLRKILGICVVDWKKHQHAHAAAEPESLDPRKYLRKLYAAADARGVLQLPHGVTVKAYRNRGYCVEATLLGYSYCIVSDFLGKSGSEDNVVVEDVTPLSVRKGKIVATISSARSSTDFIQQIVNAVLTHTPGNHTAREANAAAEPGVAHSSNLPAALLYWIHRVAVHSKCSKTSVDKIKSLHEKFEANTGTASPRFVVVMEFPGHNSGEGVACAYDGEYLNVWYSGSLGGDIPAELRANARNRIHVRGSTPQAIAVFVRTFYGKCLTEYQAALDRMDAELQGLNDGNNP